MEARYQHESMFSEIWAEMILEYLREIGCGSVPSCNDTESNKHDLGYLFLSALAPLQPILTEKEWENNNNWYYN